MAIYVPNVFERPGGMDRGEGGLAEISKALGPLNQATRTLPMHLAAIMQRMRFNSDRGPADEPIMQDPVGPPNDIFPDPSPVPPGMQPPFPFPFPTRPPGMPPPFELGQRMPYQNPGDLLRGMPAPIGGLPSIFNSRQQSEFM
jgi:hypothetical protein